MLMSGRDQETVGEGEEVKEKHMGGGGEEKGRGEG